MNDQGKGPRTGPRWMLYDPDEQHFPGIEAVPRSQYEAVLDLLERLIRKSIISSDIHNEARDLLTANGRSDAK